MAAMEFDEVYEENRGVLVSAEIGVCSWQMMFL